MPPTKRETMTVEQSLAELVAIDSVSARSNAEIISYLEARCAALGFTVKRFSHLDETGAEKINLSALQINSPAAAHASV